ncbi:hypothetical protein [Streptomyces vinaceus]|uniref:hypothetical protein n=1 Tax=Streptomyces vinaceus TaxID=1960 RepID=UPI0036888B48
MNAPTTGHSRRSLLAAALAVPTAAVGATALGSAPAAAAESGLLVVQPWTTLTLAPHLLVRDGNPPQARILKIAGTDFLQMRGGLSCEKGYEFDGGSTPETLDLLGTLPAALTPATTYVRGVAPRNNRDGLSSCRIEVTLDGKIYVYGATAANKISWIQLDSFSAVWR